MSNQLVFIFGTVCVIVLILCFNCHHENKQENKRYQDIKKEYLPQFKSQEQLTIDHLKEKLSLIHPSFQELDIRPNDESFTEDKKTIYLCIHDPHTKQLYDTNTLMYVILHELAHLLNTYDYGHTDTFFLIFDMLLCKAIDIGIYDPTLPHKHMYCGVDISNISAPKCHIIDTNEKPVIVHKEEMIEL